MIGFIIIEFWSKTQGGFILGRNVTIQVWNKTQGNFLFVSDTIIHGKYQNGCKPPTEISKDKMESFEVGNHTGAKVGPKGKVTYQTTQNSETFNIIFDWDHPFSASTSSYHCYSSPIGKVTAVLSPEHPIGHNQSITWTVQLNREGAKFGAKCDVAYSK